MTDKIPGFFGVSSAAALALIWLLAAPQMASAQTSDETTNGSECEQAEVELVDQQDLKTFGQRACTIFEGNLHISGSVIESLADLQSLQEVEGDLRLVGNMSLTSLAGLEQLERVGGDLVVAYHPKLRDLSGLAGLRQVGGHLRLIGLFEVESLEGLAGLESVRNTLQIAYLPKLESLDGLQALRSAGGLTIEGHQRLGRVDLPPALVVVSGSLEIRDNPGLATIAASDDFQRITGDVLISHNGAVERCRIERLLGGIGRSSDEENITLEQVSDRCTE